MAYFASATDVIGRMSERGVALRLDDRPEGMTQVLREATNRVKAFCMPRYDATILQTDADAGGFVNDLATSLACCILSRRRGNPIPKAFKDACDQTNEDLEMIRRGSLALPDVAERNTSSPAFSNINVMPGYIYRKVRVEAPISETTNRTGYTPAVDWFSVGWVEY